MPHINRFFLSYSVLNNRTIAQAILRLFALPKKKTIQFIYTAFRNTIGINSPLFYFRFKNEHKKSPHFSVRALKVINYMVT